MLTISYDIILIIGGYFVYNIIYSYVRIVYEYFKNYKI